MSSVPGGIVLAAGSSRRMGPVNKLVLPVEGRPMVCRVVRALLGGGVRPVVVVTGYDAGGVREALMADGFLESPGDMGAGDDGVTLRHNPEHGQGLSTSLATGLDALHDAPAVIVALGDMPWVTADHVASLVAAWQGTTGPAVCVPEFEGRLGNPVLWSHHFLADMRGLTGDRGAKSIMSDHPDRVVRVPMADDAVLRDIDSPDAYSSGR